CDALCNVFHHWPLSHVPQRTIVPMYATPVLPSATTSNVRASLLHVLQVVLCMLPGDISACVMSYIVHRLNMLCPVAWSVATMRTVLVDGKIVTPATSCERSTGVSLRRLDL